MARDDRAVQPPPLYSNDPETEAAFGPWTDFFNEIERGQQAGNLMPKEEMKRRWDELEKQHGPLPLERLTRPKERNSMVPRMN